MINFKHILIVIILLSIFSGCIRQPPPSENSVSTVAPTNNSVSTVAPTTNSVPTVAPTTTTMFEIGPQQDASTSASIYIESSAENITIYVPILLDENKNVLKMYETPTIRGNSSKVTTAIIDTEYGEALQIRRSGLDYLFNWNDVPGNDTGRFVKWLEYRGFTEQGDKLDIRKTNNGNTLTAYVSRVGYDNVIEYTYRINEKKVLESTRRETGLFFAKEENGKLNIYSGDIEISMNEKHGVLKEDIQTFYDFFRKFTISMSKFTSPDPFINMTNSEFRPEIDAWVYLDGESEKVIFYFHFDHGNRINQIARSISIGTEGWVRLKKGWQVVNLSGSQAVS